MTEFREGDRVAVEGTVWHRDHDGDDPTLVLYTESGGTFEVAAADVTLLDRPTPPLPTEPEVLREALTDEWGDRRDTGERCPLCRRKWTHHGDDDDSHYDWSRVFEQVFPLGGATPDPDTRTRCEASGMTRYLCQATDLCDCFEPRVVPDGDAVGDPITVHNAHNYEQDAGAYQPDMSGRTADPQDVGRESAAAPTPVAPGAPRSNAEAGPAEVCECGHGREGHGSLGGCLHFAGFPPGRALCLCTAYRPAYRPATDRVCGSCGHGTAHIRPFGCLTKGCPCERLVRPTPSTEETR